MDLETAGAGPAPDSGECPSTGEAGDNLMLESVCLEQASAVALLFLTHKSTGPNKKSYCQNLGSSLSNFIKAPEPDIK